ncbi:MAG: hypothetical protein U5N56_06015 [Candidatus Marinimicrobia bacterium]|nr:hypothetical protein [Candidatus Neomarinimicrobiota bacterium]
MKSKLFTTILVLVSFLTAMDLFVPVQDPVYDYLERMATRGIIPGLLNDTRPLQRDIIAEYLHKVLMNEDKLNRVERELLYDLLPEYRIELRNKRHRDLPPDNDHWLGIASFDNFKEDLRHVFHDDPSKKNAAFICMKTRTPRFG